MHTQKLEVAFEIVCALVDFGLQRKEKGSQARREEVLEREVEREEARCHWQIA